MPRRPAPHAHGISFAAVSPSLEAQSSSALPTIPPTVPVPSSQRPPFTFTQRNALPSQRPS